MNRPTSVTVFGVLNVVFSILALLGILMAALFVAVGSAPGRFGGSAVAAMQSHPVLRVWAIVSLPLGLVAAIVLFAAGIGLLLLKPWARVASIGYGIYAIIMAITGVVLNVTIAVPLMARTPASGPGGEVAAMAGTIGAVIGGIISLIYPTLLIVFMTRRTVIDAFRAGTEPF
ncbi:MAG: hypothetical protein ACYTFZ_02625 [Planctomycetota bacterium]|jgi:hypothetical protein